MTLFLSFAFTYAGVEEGIFEAFQNIYFNINFVINAFQVWVLTYLAYHLHFHRQLGFLRSTVLVYALFLGFTWGQRYLFEYEYEDLVEMYSITLPFRKLSFDIDQPNLSPVPKKQCKSGKASRGGHPVFY